MLRVKTRCVDTVDFFWHLLKKLNSFLVCTRCPLQFKSVSSYSKTLKSCQIFCSGLLVPFFKVFGYMWNIWSQFAVFLLSVFYQINAALCFSLHLIIFVCFAHLCLLLEFALDEGRSEKTPAISRFVRIFWMMLTTCFTVSLPPVVSTTSVWTTWSGTSSCGGRWIRRASCPSRSSPVSTECRPSPLTSTSFWK